MTKEYKKGNVEITNNLLPDALEFTFYGEKKLFLEKKDVLAMRDLINQVLETPTVKEDEEFAKKCPYRIPDCPIDYPTLPSNSEKECTTCGHKESEHNFLNLDTHTKSLCTKCVCEVYRPTELPVSEKEECCEKCASRWQDPAYCEQVRDCPCHKEEVKEDTKKDIERCKVGDHIGDYGCACGMVGTYPSLIEPPKEPVKKPSERIGEMKIAFDYRDSCGANNCECYSNSVQIQSIIQYLDEVTK